MSSWYGDRLTLLAFAVASHVLLLSCKDSNDCDGSDNASHDRPRVGRAA